MILIEEHGEDIEYDLQSELGVDLLDFFRGHRPWRQLYRFLRHLPAHGWYQTALAMDEKVGWERAQKPLPDTVAEPPTPLGYSLPVLLQLREIDLLKELLRVMPAVFSGKMPPPIPPEPRPQTAEQKFRELMDRIEVNNVLAAMGVKT